MFSNRGQLRFEGDNHEKEKWSLYGLFLPRWIEHSGVVIVEPWPLLVPMKL